MIQEVCSRKPSFGVEGSKVRVHCEEHAEEGMVNVVSKHCVQEGRSQRPIFGVETSEVHVYCRKHAEESMMDITTGVVPRRVAAGGSTSVWRTARYECVVGRTPMREGQTLIIGVAPGRDAASDPLSA